MSLTEIKEYPSLIQELSNSLNLEDCITPSLKKVVDKAFESCVGRWDSFNACFKQRLEPLNFSNNSIESIKIKNLKEIFDSHINPKTSSSTFSAIGNFLCKKEVLIISALAITTLIGYKASCGSKKQQESNQIH